MLPNRNESKPICPGEHGQRSFVFGRVAPPVKLRAMLQMQANRPKTNVKVTWESLTDGLTWNGKGTVTGGSSSHDQETFIQASGNNE